MMNREQAIEAVKHNGNARYNDEVIFLDGIMDSHPNVIKSLSDEDRHVMEVYYLIGRPVPDSIFIYREHLLRDQPDIQARAESAFARLLESLNMNEFNYSTRT